MIEPIKKAEVEMKQTLLFPEEDFFYEVRKFLYWSIPFEEVKEKGLERYFYDEEPNLVDDLKRIYDSRPRTLRNFFDEKGRPITNYIKGLVRQAFKERNIKLDEEEKVIAKLLNEVRNWYGEEGVLKFELYESEAFFEFQGTCGDEHSCFRTGGCNEAHAVWMSEYMEDEFRFIVIKFYDKEDVYIGQGRCWLYIIDDGAVFVTNFYSIGFDIKRHCFRYPIVRGIRQLMGWRDAHFTRKDVPLPVYLNGDGLIIWNPKVYNASDEIIKEISETKRGVCMNCGESFPLYSLTYLDDDYYLRDYGEILGGGIVCEDCKYNVEKAHRCEHCGRPVPESEAYLIDDLVYCETCYYELFVPCEICDCDIYREDAVIDAYGNCLCSDCLERYRLKCEECEEYYEEEDIVFVQIVDWSDWEDKEGRRGFPDLTEKTICDRCLKDWEEDAYIFNCRYCGTLTIIPIHYAEKYPYLKEMAEEKVCAYPQCQYLYRTDKLEEEVA